MSKRLKFNVKNVISGLQNFSDLLAGQESRHHHGFSRLVLPRSIPLCRSDCKYFKQHQHQSRLDFPKFCILSPTSEGRSLKKICSEIPPSKKWPDTVNLGSVCMPPAQELPWDSPYRFYYDQKKPQCPPEVPKPCSDDGKENKNCDSKCPSLEAALPPKPDPCAPKRASPKNDPCSRKMSTYTVPLSIYRFASRCGKKGSGKGSGKGPICPPQKKPPDCSGGAKKKGGNACPPPKKVKDCPPKGKEGGEGGGKGGICPPPKACPPTRKAGEGKGGKRVCGKPKSKKGSKPDSGSSRKGEKCRPKGCKSSGGGGKGGSSRKAGKCSPKGSKSSGGGGGGGCRASLKKARPCTPKTAGKGDGSKCGSQSSKPKKPKCK